MRTVLENLDSFQKFSQKFFNTPIFFFQKTGIQGCHGQGKIRGKQFFFKVREKSGNCVSSQGMSKLYLKVIEKSGNFTFDWPFGLGRRFLGSKGVFVSNNPAKELIDFCCFIAGLLPKDLPWMVSENWSLVRVKSGKCQGNFFLSQ